MLNKMSLTLRLSSKRGTKHTLTKYLQFMKKVQTKDHRCQLDIRSHNHYLTHDFCTRFNKADVH